MRNFKIGTRLTLGFGLIIILLLVMTGIGMWRMMDTEKGNSVLEGHQQANSLILQWARQVDVNANQVLASANLTNPNVLETFQKGMAASSKRADEIRRQLESLLHNAEAVALYQSALKAREIYANGRDQAFKDLNNGEYAKADEFFNKTLPQVTTAYIDSIDKLSSLQTSLLRQEFQNSNENNELGMGVLIIATILALLIGPLFAFMVTRSIVRPLRRAVTVAEGVAQRDLRQHTQVQGKDEISSLERALQGMVNSLQDVVGEVRSGANSIASAAAQISSGNLDLSSRTEEQASSLAQTAATMEELTATVRQNADNTQQANTLASAAAKFATEGGTVVAEVVHTMSEINEKSKQVADILGVIDSIAFQTNILALNAAVEAARAGEQGRGFAVVASEVRALAQRSATAAREIKTLIDASVSATTKGNEQVTRAGTTMEEIVAGINRVTDIMGEINAANQEQTTGIEEINSAVMQMDDVTRQNASLVEESAAAASSLQGQADTLATLVETFQLAADQGTTGTRRTAPPKADAQPKAEKAQAAPQNSARIPSLPEKSVGPTPHRPKSAAAATAPASTPKQAPALRAPEPATEEWTEF